MQRVYQADVLRILAASAQINDNDVLSPYERVQEILDDMQPAREMTPERRRAQITAFLLAAGGD